jgi:hypothetical protein
MKHKSRLRNIEKNMPRARFVGIFHRGDGRVKVNGNDYPPEELDALKERLEAEGAQVMEVGFTVNEAVSST